MKLTNIRPVRRGNTPMMAADFEVADGRKGCVEVTATEWEQHGDVVLEQCAHAVALAAERDLYQPRARDRFSELT